MSCLKPLSFGEICYVAIVADAHSLDPTDFPPPKSVGFCLSNLHQYVIVIQGGDGTALRFLSSVLETCLPTTCHQARHDCVLCAKKTLEFRTHIGSTAFQN